VLLLLVYRPAEDSTSETNRIAKLPYFTEIRLTDLTPEQAEQWITIKASQLYGLEERPPAEFTSRLIERAEGNPFYIEETLNYIKDNDLSLREVESLADIDLPASLNSLVLTRIDQLPERPRSTLRIASVFGRSFKTPFLSGAHPDVVGENGISEELIELDRKGFIEVESEVDESYLFKHSVIQEVAYESLPFGMRHGLHRKIGEFIEATFQESLEEQIDLLAYHFFSGEAWLKALDYKLEAARQSLGKYANDDAIGAARYWEKSWASWVGTTTRWSSMDWRAPWLQARHRSREGGNLDWRSSAMRRPASTNGAASLSLRWSGWREAWLELRRARRQ
jgi:predicted ATPase